MSHTHEGGEHHDISYPKGLDPVRYCVFAKELPKKHGPTCGQCAAIEHAFHDAAEKAANFVREVVGRESLKKAISFKRMARALALRFPKQDIQNITRASGDAECETCGLAYVEHPDAPEGVATVRILCDGRRVKL